MFASRKRKASDEADSPPSRHLSPLHRVLHHPDQYQNKDQNKDQDPRSFSSYSSFHAYSHSHSPSPILHHRPLPSASPDKTPHRALPSRGYPSQNSRSLSIASLLNNEAPAPPSPEPEYSIHLPPIRNPAFSASPSIGVDDDCDDDADSDDMTRLKTGSNKASEAPRRRVPSAISPVSSTSHSVGTSAEPPQSLGSVTPNAREQAHRDRIKARKTQEGAAKEEELIAKPPTCSISVTNKPRMASPDVFVRETASLERVVQVATHVPVPADRNVVAKEERPSYDNDNDNDSEETDLFVRDEDNSVSSKCDTPIKSVTPETETIPQASTQIAVEAVTETAPVMVAGPTEPAPSEESITKQSAEGAAKSERPPSTNKKPHENHADDPARVQTPVTTNDDSSDDDVPLIRARRPVPSKGRESDRWTYSPTEKKRGDATPATSPSGRMNSGIVSSKETHDGEAGTPPTQAFAGRKTLPTTSQSTATHHGHTSASQTPIPSVEGSGHKRVLIPARRALENLGHTADIKSSSERSDSQKAVTPSEDGSAAPEAKIPSVKALSAVPDISQEPSKESSVGSELGHVTDTYTQAIDPAESDESGDVDMFSSEVPTAPEANMRVSPDLPPTENKESTQLTKSASKTDTTKNAEPAKSPEPEVTNPEKSQPEAINTKNEAPRIEKPKNRENQSTATVPIKPSPRIKIVKKSSTKAQPRPQPSANVHIIGHRKMAKGDYDFELHLKEGDTTWWDEEVDLFSESPEIVSDYWNSVRGGRERACDGMWKIWKIFDERKVGNRKESLVGWLGTMDRTWEPKAYVRANALDVLKEWEQGKAEKEEASHMAWDGPEEEEEDLNDDEPLKGTTRKRATPTKTRKGQAYKVKKPRRSAH